MERTVNTKVCNICGMKIDHVNKFEGFTASEKIGYGSIHDGETLDLHVCSDCMDRMVASCRVSPIKKAVAVPVRLHRFSEVKFRGVF